MSKISYLIIISILSVAILWVLEIRARESPRPVKETNNAIQLAKDFPRIFAQGRVEAVTGEIELRPPLSEPVAEIYVSEGQHVTVGQSLLRLDDRHYRHRAELAKAELLEAQARLQRLQNGPTSYEQSEVKANYEAKMADLQRQEAMWKRVTKLLQAQAVPQQEADDHWAKLQALRAEVVAAKARLERLMNEPRSDDLQIANTLVQAAQARWELANAELARGTLRAPIGGQVVKLHVELGELAGPSSSEPAVIIADPSRKRIRAYVEELDAPQLRLGMPARITADGLRGKQYTGRVTWLSSRMGTKTLWSNRPDERRDTKTREVIVELDGSTEELVVGLRVDVSIHSVPVRENSRQQARLQAPETPKKK